MAEFAERTIEIEECPEPEFSQEDLDKMANREMAKRICQKSNFKKNFFEEMNRPPTHKEIAEYFEKFNKGKIDFFTYINELKNRCNSGMQQVRE